MFVRLQEDIFTFSLLVCTFFIYGCDNKPIFLLPPQVCSFASHTMNNYFMYMGGQGTYTATMEYEREYNIIMLYNCR